MLYKGLTFPNTCWKMKTCQLLWTNIVVPVQKTHGQEWQGVPRIGEHQLRCLCYKNVLILTVRPIWSKCWWIIKWIQNWLYKIDQIKRRPTPKPFSSSECLCIPCTDSNRLNLMCHQVKKLFFPSSWLALAFTNVKAKKNQICSQKKSIHLDENFSRSRPRYRHLLHAIILWTSQYGSMIQNMVQ